MAFHVKTKKPWKNVDIGAAGFSQKDLEGFISLEELTDYEIIDSKKRKLRKGKKEEDDDGQNIQETDVSQHSPKPNTKNGKQQKKKVKGEEQSRLGGNVDQIEDKTNCRKDKDGRRKKMKLKTKSPKKTLLEGKQQTVEDINDLMEAESSTLNIDKQKQKQKKNGNKRKSQDPVVEEGEPNKKVKLESPNVQGKLESPNVQGKLGSPNVQGKLGSPNVQWKLTAPADKSLKGMDAWKELFVPVEVLWALRDQGFTEPTQIQSQILPSAIRDQMDIVGAAETGSGKTLAFGIPLLHYILEERRAESDRLLRGTVDEDSEGLSEDSEDEEDCVNSDNDGDTLTELPENSEDESEDDDNNDDDDDDDDDDDVDESAERTDPAAADATNDEETSSDEEVGDIQPDGRGCVKVLKNVDFSWLEETKDIKPQATHPRALILEPTRELAIQVKNHLMAAAKYTDIRIAVIVGGLAMAKQQRILKKCPDILVATPGRLWELVQQGEVYLSEIEKTCHLVIDEADRMVEKGHFEELSKLLEKMKRDPDKENRHTYVFSATLTLIHSGPQRMLKKKKKKWDEKQKLYYLRRKMGLKPKPKVVDITRKVGTVDSLTEARIACTMEDKDIYLYYFLKHYRGRTLVFTNSKDCIRRLVSIFTLLQCNPLPLHADMHQRQRLKNLDKFTANPNGILMASDVAARGLDIPNVQHVIHYQVPHTVENYVHRSGRTARASKEGLSIMITGPGDAKNYRKIINTLNKNEELPLFPVEQEILSEIRRRVNMVRQIETQEYRFKKSKRHNDWFRKAADEVGVDIDDDGLLDDLGDDTEQRHLGQYIKQMKTELAITLKQPLQTRSSFTKYPTMSGRLMMPPAREEKGDAVSHVKKHKKIQEDLVTNTSLVQKQGKSRKDRRRQKKKNKELSNKEDS